MSDTATQPESSTPEIPAMDARQADLVDGKAVVDGEQVLDHATDLAVQHPIDPIKDQAVADAEGPKRRFEVPVQSGSRPWRPVTPGTAPQPGVTADQPGIISRERAAFQTPSATDVAAGDVDADAGDAGLAALDEDPEVRPEKAARSTSGRAKAKAADKS